MLKPLTIILIGCGIVLPLAAFTQRLSDVPLGVIPMQYIPSFAGQVGGPRFSSNIGYGYWMYNSIGGITGSESTTQAYNLYTSYDQFIPAIRSGIGVLAGFSDKNEFLAS